MDIFENISLAIAGLKANKMRTMLTMLGIIIGIAAVIAIMTVGNSLTNSVTSSMQDMGANNITVSLQEKSDEEKNGVFRGMNGGGGFMGNESADVSAVPDESDYITDDMIISCRKCTVTTSMQSVSAKPWDREKYRKTGCMQT